MQSIPGRDGYIRGIEMDKAIYAGFMGAVMLLLALNTAISYDRIKSQREFAGEIKAFRSVLERASKGK